MRNITVSHLSDSYHFRKPQMNQENVASRQMIYCLLPTQLSRFIMAVFLLGFTACETNGQVINTENISSAPRLIRKIFHINTTTFQIKVYDATVHLSTFFFIYTHGTMLKRKSTSSGSLHFNIASFMGFLLLFLGFFDQL